MFHFKKKLKIFKMNKKNQEEENELFFYLSYNSHFFYTKTSIFNDLKHKIENFQNEQEKSRRRK